jgi:hypothetical protein
VQSEGGEEGSASRNFPMAHPTRPLAPHPDGSVHRGGDDALAAALLIPPLSSLSIPLTGGTVEEAHTETAPLPLSRSSLVLAGFWTEASPPLLCIGSRRRHHSKAVGLPAACTHEEITSEKVRRSSSALFSPLRLGGRLFYLALFILEPQIYSHCYVMAAKSI